MIRKETPLSDVLEIGKGCQRRNNCCKHGSGCLVNDDLRNISLFLGISEKEVKEKYLEGVEKFNTRLFRPKIVRDGKPYGVCIFFDEKGCKIHSVKPTECKVGNCGERGEELSKWFMLNNFVNAHDPESIRQYAIYLKTHEALPGGELRELVPDEGRLRKILDFTILK